MNRTFYSLVLGAPISLVPAVYITTNLLGIIGIGVLIGWIICWAIVSGVIYLLWPRK